MSEWTTYGLPEPQREFKFHPTRKWRFDFAWPANATNPPRKESIAVEIEGAVWVLGRHTRGSGFVKDMEKYNEAAKHGWRVFRFTPQELKKGIAQSFMLDIFK